MCHPSKSDIVTDPIVLYFTSMESFTNIYKFGTGQGGGYGHDWKNVVVDDLVQFNVILVRGGVIGGSNGALYKLWDHNLPMYSPEISQDITLTRFGEIKINVKLCNNDAAKSR